MFSLRSPEIISQNAPPMFNCVQEGGNAGLKYLAYQMKTGEEFRGSRTYPSIEECIRFDHDCMGHYRDGTMKVNYNDLQALRKIVEYAIEWCNRVND